MSEDERPTTQKTKKQTPHLFRFLNNAHAQHLEAERKRKKMAASRCSSVTGARVVVVVVAVAVVVVVVVVVVRRARQLSGRGGEGGLLYDWPKGSIFRKISK